jgi:hypothetical protein
MANYDTPTEVSTDRQTLSESETKALQLAFERGLEDTRTLNTETVRAKLEEYSEEIGVAASIARAQFQQQFGGLNPAEGQFAVSRIHSGYFGYDSWENLGSLTSGELNDYIDSENVDNLSSGNTGFAGPIKVGEQAVHVIMGFSTYHDSPKTSAIKYEVNESPRPALKTKYEFTETDLQTKWLDRPIILPENSLFAARIYADVGGDDFVRPEGLTFIKYRASQIADPSEMTDDTGSSDDNIVAQG